MRPIISWIVFVWFPVVAAGRAVKIGVIGAGLGGTSCAGFLRQLLPDAELEILESEKVGGRLATIPIGEAEYEVGGSIIHPLNLYMVNYTKLFGLESIPVVPGVLGLHDGNEFVFLGSESSWQTILSLGWRYGGDMLVFNSLIEEAMGKFGRIYQVQDAGLAYTSVEALVSMISPEYTSMIRTPFKAYLKEVGFSDLFIAEFAEAISLVNYGQTVESLKGFVGAATLAAASEDLWAIKGGNWQIAEKFLEASQPSKLINCHVSSIKQTEISEFKVFCRGATEPLSYTHVIIATPFMTNGPEGISVELLEPVKVPSGPYKHRIATLVEGLLNSQFFSADMTSDELPSQIFFCNSSIFFHSVNLQHATSDSVPVGKLPVYKVFSDEILTQSQLAQLFTEIASVETVEWMAFPDYSVINEDKYSFELSENLYYLNSIEFAASAMEMAIVSGRNAALLLYNRESGQDDKINADLSVSPPHTEL